MGCILWRQSLVSRFFLASMILNLMACKCVTRGCITRSEASPGQANIRLCVCVWVFACLCVCVGVCLRVRARVRAWVPGCVGMCVCVQGGSG